MKILMVAAENDALPGGKVGGIGDVVRDIPIALATAGHEVDVITPGYGAFSKLPGSKSAVHFKDHVMIRAEDAGQLTVAGVPVGDGFLPLTELTRRLLSHGLRRFTFENVWAYSAPIQDGRKALDGVNLGDGAFAYLDPPFDPARVVLRQSELGPQTLVDLENSALHRGHKAFRQILKNLGTTGDWDAP